MARFGKDKWRRQGADYEPLPDGLESPWSDLWFYSNPVFVHIG